MELSGKASPRRSYFSKHLEEERDLAMQTDIWGKNIPGRQNSECKGSEAEKLIQPLALQRASQHNGVPKASTGTSKGLGALKPSSQDHHPHSNPRKRSEKGLIITATIHESSTCQALSASDDPQESCI